MSDPNLHLPVYRRRRLMFRGPSWRLVPDVGIKNKFQELDIVSADYRICVEVPILIERKKYKYTEISAIERKRISGKKNVSEFKDGFLILKQMIIMFFSRKN